MKKVISFMHVSLDGFVAGPNGELDWATVDEEIFGYVSKRINEGNTAMYGRVTYQMMENYWPTAADQPDVTVHHLEHSKWYMNVHKIIVSKTMKGVQLPNATIVSDNLSDKIKEVKLQADGDILLFGSPSATQSLMAKNLIDGFWLFVNPIILGQGMPLFADIKEKIKLKLLPPSRQFKAGVTELNYTVDKSLVEN